MSVNASFKKVWAREMQEVLWPGTVWTPQANFRLESELKGGDKIQRIGVLELNKQPFISVQGNRSTAPLENPPPKPKPEADGQTPAPAEEKPPAARTDDASEESHPPAESPEKPAAEAASDEDNA